jgi:hypothetical protein
VTKQSVTQKLVFPFLEVSPLKEEMDIDDQDGGNTLWEDLQVSRSARKIIFVQRNCHRGTPENRQHKMIDSFPSFAS